MISLLTPLQRLSAWVLLEKHGVEVSPGVYVMRSSWDDKTVTPKQRLYVQRYFEEQAYSIPDE